MRKEIKDQKLYVNSEEEYINDPEITLKKGIDFITNMRYTSIKRNIE
jgi:hypothetical protein